jgi:TRAP-type C4-dicarboxylate transport system permease small subunit
VLGGVGWYRAAHTARFGVALTGASLSALAVALVLAACAVHLRLVRNAVNRQRVVLVEQVCEGAG